MTTAATPANRGQRDFCGGATGTVALMPDVEAAAGVEAEDADTAATDADEAGGTAADPEMGCAIAGADPESCAAGTEPELAAATARLVSVSRLRRCKSARMSAAYWYRRLRSFSSALEMMSSSLGGKSGFKRIGGTGARSRIA